MKNADPQEAFLKMCLEKNICPETLKPIYDGCSDLNIVKELECGWDLEAKYLKIMFNHHKCKMTIKSASKHIKIQKIMISRFEKKFQVLKGYHKWEFKKQSLKSRVAYLKCYISYKNYYAALLENIKEKRVQYL